MDSWLLLYSLHRLILVMTPPTDPLPSSTADKVDDDSIKQLNEKDKVQPRQDTVDADGMCVSGM